MRNKEDEPGHNSHQSPAAELYEAIRNGDEAAFAAYYNEVQERFTHFITRLIGDEDEAVNIVHDAFLKLWEQRENITKLNGFIYTAATNGARDLLRKSRVHAKYCNEQRFLQNDGTPAADESILVDELSERIREAVQNMPPQRRKVFEMSRNQGLTYNEIAERLSLSHGTVKKHMEIALEQLRDRLSLSLLFLFLALN